MTFPSRLTLLSLLAILLLPTAAAATMTRPGADLAPALTDSVQKLTRELTAKHPQTVAINTPRRAKNAPLPTPELRAYLVHNKTDWYVVVVDRMGKGSTEINPYAYCRNNPLKYTDPTGMWEISSSAPIATAESKYLFFGRETIRDLAKTIYNSIASGWALERDWEELANRILVSHNAHALTPSDRIGGIDEPIDEGRQIYFGQADIFSANQAMIFNESVVSHTAWEHTEYVLSAMAVTSLAKYGIGRAGAAFGEISAGAGRRLAPGFTGESGMVLNPFGESTSTLIKEALAGLRPGRSPRVYVVNSTDELETLFNRLRVGGRVESGSYPGRFVKFEDGTTVGLRAQSTSGGPTIDVELGTGASYKVHVQ